ncbi:MAG: DoxX family membrane protein, partial [Gemmatimonadota bacterium]
ARGILGLIFFMAGVYKVFDLGPVGHVEKFFLPFQATFLPTWSLWAVGLTIPFVELGAGALVLLGFFRTAAYGALGVVLVVVTFGHLLQNPLYPFHEHVIPRAALLLLLLLMPPESDRFAVDEIRRRAHRSGPSEVS